MTGLGLTGRLHVRLSRCCSDEVRLNADLSDSISSKLAELETADCTASVLLRVGCEVMSGVVFVDGSFEHTAAGLAKAREVDDAERQQLCSGLGSCSLVAECVFALPRLKSPCCNDFDRPTCSLLSGMISGFLTIGRFSIRDMKL